jgi:hypothetical protein
VPQAGAGSGVPQAGAGSGALQAGAGSGALQAGAGSDLPSTGAAQTTQCATSSEAYALVDAGFGYALVPTVYTMPDPFHRVLRWRDSTRAVYGFYSREDDGKIPVRSFADVAAVEYGRI